MTPKVTAPAKSLKMDLRVLVRRILQSDPPCFFNQLAVRLINLERGEFFLEFHHHVREDDDLSIKENVKVVTVLTFTLASRKGLVSHQVLLHVRVRPLLPMCTATGKPSHYGSIVHELFGFFVLVILYAELVVAQASLDGRRTDGVHERTTASGDERRTSDGRYIVLQTPFQIMDTNTKHFDFYTCSRYEFVLMSAFQRLDTLTFVIFHALTFFD